MFCLILFVWVKFLESTQTAPVGNAGGGKKMPAANAAAVGASRLSSSSSSGSSSSSSSSSDSSDSESDSG